MAMRLIMSALPTFRSKSLSAANYFHFTQCPLADALEPGKQHKILQAISVVLP